MGAFLNFIKILGLVPKRRLGGTVFGGDAGGGVLEPITSLIPPPKPTPPIPQGQAGHHPSYVWEPLVNYVSDFLRNREREPYRKLRLAYEY